MPQIFKTPAIRPSSDAVVLRRRIITERMPGAVRAELSDPDRREDLRETFTIDKSVELGRAYLGEMAEAIANAPSNKERNILFPLFEFLAQLAFTKTYEEATRCSISYEALMQGFLDYLGVEKIEPAKKIKAGRKPKPTAPEKEAEVVVIDGEKIILQEEIETGPHPNFSRPKKIAINRMVAIMNGFADEDATPFPPPFTDVIEKPPPVVAADKDAPATTVTSAIIGEGEAQRPAAPTEPPSAVTPPAP